jgi:tRNA(fMet)-specific endonuclease VapC
MNSTKPAFQPQNTTLKTGRLIDDIDILIAGIALSNNLVMVTDNTEHFKRIGGLKVENWRA